jgi:hypothetical protein
MKVLGGSAVNSRCDKAMVNNKTSRICLIFEQTSSRWSAVKEEFLRISIMAVKKRLRYRSPYVWNGVVKTRSKLYNTELDQNTKWR